MTVHFTDTDTDTINFVYPGVDTDTDADTVLLSVMKPCQLCTSHAENLTNRAQTTQYNLLSASHSVLSRSRT